MAYTDSPTGTGLTEEQLAAMRRAIEQAAAQNADPAFSWSGSDVNPTNTSARTDIGTVYDTTPTPTSSWSGSDTNQTNSSFAPSSSQLDAMRRAIADTAAWNAAQPVPQPSGSWSGSDVNPTNTSSRDLGSVVPQSSWSGSDLNPTNSSAIGDTSAIQRALAGGTSTGQSDLSTAAATGGTLGGAAATGGGAVTGGSLGSTINPPTTGLSVGDAFTKMTQGINNQVTGAGAGTADTSALARAAGAGAVTSSGPAGAGSSTIDAGAGAGSPGSIGALTNSIVTQLQGIGQSLTAPGTSPDVQGVYMQQATAILRLLDEQEKSLRADAEKQGTSIDPSLQFSLDKMRETLDENLKTTREDLNRRGLYNSGVLLDLEGKLRKGNASDQAMLMASRFAKLQDQLTQGLASIRSQRYSTANQYGLAAANAQTSSDENARRRAYDAEQESLKNMLALRSQVSGEQNTAANRSFQGNESALQRAFNAEQANLDRQYGDAQNKAKTAAEFEQNRLAYEREKDLINQRATSGAYGGAGGGGSARPAAAARTTAAATGDITDQAIAEMHSTFTNAADAQAAIKDPETLRKLAAAGVDIAALYNAAQGIGTTQGWGGSRRIGTADY